MIAPQWQGAAVTVRGLPKLSFIRAVVFVSSCIAVSQLQFIQPLFRLLLVFATIAFLALRQYKLSLDSTWLRVRWLGVEARIDASDISHIELDTAAKDILTRSERHVLRIVKYCGGPVTIYTDLEQLSALRLALNLSHDRKL